MIPVVTTCWTCGEIRPRGELSAVHLALGLAYDDESETVATVVYCGNNAECESRAEAELWRLFVRAARIWRGPQWRDALKGQHPYREVCA